MAPVSTVQLLAVELLSRGAATVVSQGRKPLEFNVRLNASPLRGDSAGAFTLALMPLTGLEYLPRIQVQGLTPLANHFRPFGTQT
jgi:hypothetical protein